MRSAPLLESGCGAGIVADCELEPGGSEEFGGDCGSDACEADRLSEFMRFEEECLEFCIHC